MSLRTVVTSLEAGGVQRFHSAPYVVSQTVAEHSWGVAAIVMYLCPKDYKERSKLIEAAIVHDIPEIEMGDIPAPVKWANPAIHGFCEEWEEKFYDSHGMLNPEEHLEARSRVILKLADWLDGLRWTFINENHRVRSYTGDLKGDGGTVHSRWLNSFNRHLLEMQDNELFEGKFKCVLDRALMLAKRFS